MVCLQRENRSRQTRGDILVAKLVHGDGCVLGVGVADVRVAIVLWNKVHIVEEETIPVFLLHGLPETHIHQLGPVKCVVSSLQSNKTLNAKAGCYTPVYKYLNRNSFITSKAKSIL